MGCSKVRYRTDIQDNISVPVPVRRIPTESSDVEMKEGDKEKDKNKDVFEPVTIKECLDIFTADEIVGFNCPSCGKDAKATKYVLKSHLIPVEMLKYTDDMLLRLFRKF